MLPDVVLGLEEILDLRGGRLQRDPALVSGQTQILAREARVHEPARHGGDGLIARRKQVHDLRGTVVLAEARGFGVCHLHEELLDAVNVRLGQPEAHREDLVCIEAV